MPNSELTRELNLLVLKTRMTFRQAVQKELKRNNVDMTFEMLQIMHSLWTRQGVSQQYLAEKTAKDKACLTNLINNLEKKGWVIRKEDPSDRRNRLICLTSEGEEISNQIKPLINNIYAQVGEKISARQLQSCINHLQKLNELFEKI